MLEKENKKVNREKKFRRSGVPLFQQVRRLIVGAGDSAFHAGREGIWLGAKKYEDAPFRVNLRGVIEAASFIGTIVTAQILKTSETGQRVVIDDVSNTIRFYNSANKLILELQGLTAFESASQIKMAGGITGTSKEDANYEAGFRIWNGGFGATGVAAFIQAFNNETDTVVATMSVRTDGDVYFYGTGASPVAAIKNDGTLECTNLWPILPTSDPEVPGMLWNDAGTVKVSP